MPQTKRVCKTVVVKGTAKLAPKSRSARVTNPVTGEVKKSAKGIPLRSFALVSVDGKKVNRDAMYCSNPSGCAKKLFNAWCDDNKKTTCPKVVVCIRESTRGSLQKEYKYDCKRVKLDKPIVTNNGTYKYTTECKAHKK